VFRMETPLNARSERPAGERRRCVRQKIHTPAYASFDDKSEGVELSEILDISEEGIAVQTSMARELDESVNLCLDLSETNCQVRTSAHVVRLEASGRAAIRFPEMPEPARQQLKEWLFLNAMMAAANQSSAFLEPETFDSEQTHSDFTSRLMALSAVDREVELLGSDLDAALDLIARRAVSFTSASGAAIALSQGIEMICVASAGSQAPPLDSRLQAGSGFSGECVRTGKLMRCDDSEENIHVDRENCRALGIRSMIAAPIRRNGSVIGLLEVFSTRPMGLGADAETVLTHLCETAMAAIKRAGFATIRSAAENVPEENTEAAAETVSFLSSHKQILIAAACVAVLGFTILLAAPWRKSPAVAPAEAITQTSAETPNRSPRPVAESIAGTTDLQSLITLAEQGDPAAQFAVGARYATGQDGKQDYAEAIRWFTRAAEQGHVVSQATLGAYYWAGRGVKPDIERAYYWSILAQNAGDQASKYRVAVLKSRLTQPQIIAVENRANEWLRSRRGISQASKREPIP
jgi:hypothetical protein